MTLQMLGNAATEGTESSARIQKATQREKKPDWGNEVRAGGIVQPIVTSAPRPPHFMHQNRRRSRSVSGAGGMRSRSNCTHRPQLPAVNVRNEFAGGAYASASREYGHSREKVTSRRGVTSDGLCAWVCAGDRVPDVRDPASGVVASGFRSTRGVARPRNDEERRGTRHSVEQRRGACAPCGPRHSRSIVLHLRRAADAGRGFGLEAVAAACGHFKNFRFDDLRHTWASWHVTRGTTLQELMELGGWKSYEMVLRYAHLAPEHLSAAAKRIERSLGIVTLTLRFPYARPYEGKCGQRKPLCVNSHDRGDNSGSPF